MSLLTKYLVDPLLGYLGYWWGVRRDHDVAIFRKLDAIANEAGIDNILNGCLYTKSVTTEDVEILYKLKEELLRIENQYLDGDLRRQGERFAQELGALLSFVGGTFWPTGEGRRGFRPEQIDSDVYDREWEELGKKIDSAWDAYKAYRRMVKEKLHS